MHVVLKTEEFKAGWDEYEGVGLAIGKLPYLKFNRHRLARFYPSYIIFVYESFRILYGLVSEWINIILSHYMQMDRKPEGTCMVMGGGRFVTFQYFWN